MARGKKGDTVKVNYTGKLEDGTIFDTTEGRYPKELTIGGNQVLPAFEQAIVGMRPGESKTVRIPMNEAYGPHSDRLVGTMDRARLPADMKLEVGQRLQLAVTGSGGETMTATVTEVSGGSVKLDGNHPLAGKDLFFDIELLEIG
jgi:FKBP-type peptidyl-prolyl cis-trans isomerase 2